MKILWTYIGNKQWKAEAKYQAALTILSLLFALVGFVAWLAVRFSGFSSVGWMLFFIWLPVVISWIVVFFYSCDHDFCDGKA